MKISIIMILHFFSHCSLPNWAKVTPKHIQHSRIAVTPLFSMLLTEFLCRWNTRSRRIWVRVSLYYLWGHKHSRWPCRIRWRSRHGDERTARKGPSRHCSRYTLLCPCHARLCNCIGRFHISGGGGDFPGGKMLLLWPDVTMFKCRI